MKKKLPYLLPSIFFFLGTPLVWILCFREVPLRISPETTYITEPKTVDGKSIDYFAVMKDRFEPKCKPEENGFRKVVAGLGRVSYFDDPPWYWESLCRELDLDPKLTPTLKFEPPHDFFGLACLRWIDENDLFDSDEEIDSKKLWEKAHTEPWTVEELPFMLRWIEENSPMLDLVTEAVKKEFFFSPWIRPEKAEGVLAPPMAFATELLQPIREGLACRANYRLGIGDVDGAWSDAVTVTRLSVKHNENFTAVISISEPFYLEKNILRLHPVSDVDRERRLSDLDGLAPLFSFEKYVQFDRLIKLWLVAMFDRDPAPNMKYINWCRVAHLINKDYDEFERIAGKIREPDQENFIKSFSPYFLPPERSFLSEKLGKPLTVDERSKELAYGIRMEGNGPGTVFPTLKNHQDRYDELRRTLEKGPE